jgi:hypothetical protein
LPVVADAYFATSNFINPLMEKGIHVVTRWRKDGVGWDDPGPYSGRGRPRKYGTQWKLVELLQSFSPQEIKVNIYGKTVHASLVVRDMKLRYMSQKVRVVVVEGLGETIILISTDMTLTAAQIIEIYSSRFSIEIAIRDLKQHFGMGDYQCTTTGSILRFATFLCFIMHVAFDAVARKRIQLAIGSNCYKDEKDEDDKRIKIQFRPCKTRSEDVRHQTHSFS